MECKYIRVKSFIFVFIVLLLVLLFFNNNINSSEHSSIMDAEISVDRQTREAFAAPIPSLDLKKMRQFTGGRHPFRRSSTPAPRSVKSLDALGHIFTRVS